ncbi:NAD-dependent protein deacetylase sirtuin-3, mitochondrial isoform X4 [Mobula hypostoma]|uniref:NAD-dependent protein deacetylase sirtuin-3, mitochondrial isoform X4 n=1 Tax=Mobula hypostoma TaxID=723540 RepID=UPI002FC33387
MQFAICLRILCSPPCLLASSRLQCNFSVFLKSRAQSWCQSTVDGWLHRRTSKDHCVSSWCICPPVRSIFRGKSSDEKVQSLQDIASLIQSAGCSKIVVMSGAGISTPSGIPDFRGWDSTTEACGSSRDICHGNLHCLPREFHLGAAPSRGDVMEGKVPHCSSCSGVIKPNIVFFGEQLPRKFYQYLIDFPLADLLIILGTSLEVEPFASLSEMVRNSVPRILINQDLVGSLTRNPLRSKDVVELGDVVRGVKRLSDLLGWTDQVNQLLSREQSEV